MVVAVGIIMDASSTFFSPAISASYAGPLSLIGWVFLTIIFLYIASCFAELTSMFPKAGGIYEFSKHSYGRFGSFIVGWVGWLVANIGISVSIVGANDYLIPSSEPLMVGIKVALSIATILIINYITFRGVKESSFVVTGLIILLFATLIAIIVPMIFHFKPQNFQPITLFSSWRANVLALFTSMFFAAQVFFGMEEVTYLSEEVEEPEKNVPKALVFSILIIGIILIIHVFFSLGFINWAVFSSSKAPYVGITTQLYGPVIGRVFQVILYILMVGAAMGAAMATPYLLMAMSRDQLFLPQFQQKHPKYNTPYKAIIFQAFAIIFFSMIGLFGKGFESLASLLVPLSVVLYIATILSVIILRFKIPQAYRAFKAPAGRWLPLVVSAIMVLVIVMWVYTEPKASSMMNLLVSTVLLGFPIYFLIEMYYDPKMITSVSDIFSHLMYWLEDIILPKKIRAKILALLGNISGRKVLEFGAGVGTLTEELAKNIGNGVIYATDVSKHHLKINNRRMQSGGYKNVFIVHDESNNHRVHPSIPEVDAVCSSGVLGYVQNVDRVLREINHRMKIGGRICLLEYDKFFGFIPNIDWLQSDEMIIKKFEENGYRINVIRKKGFLWHYIFIYGEKSRDIYKYHYVTI